MMMRVRTETLTGKGRNVGKLLRGNNITGTNFNPSVPKYIYGNV
jgi:hypothetical protein